MSRPEVSVVMATHNSVKTVRYCLESLGRQSVSGRLEVIVADCSTDGTDELIRTQFPTVRLLRFDSPRGLPELIKEAMSEAKGRVVALTEPHCVFPEDWLENVLRAHQSRFAVVGGAVENGREDGIVSWACYFSDYGAFMLPSAQKITPVLAGNHISYKREVIEEGLKSMPGGFWKYFFNRDLTRRGFRFLFDPGLVVYDVRPDTFWSFASRYYLHARYFAALRSSEMSAGIRALRALTSPALPFLLLYRRLRDTFPKKRFRAELITALPVMALFVAIWSAGELMGYLLGPERFPQQVYQ